MKRALAFGLFLSLFAGVAAAGHWYIARRLVLDPALGSGATRALVGTVALLGATLVLAPFAERFAPRRLAAALAWPAALWMGFAFLLIVALGASDLLLALSGSLAPADGAGPQRVRAVAVMALVGAAGAAALRSGLRPPAVRRLEVPLARWPASLDGFRIVQISDIHIGAILGREFARDLTERVNALAPDLLAVTGDLVDGNVRHLADEVAPFARLRARYGVWFVTGNHDHYSGARAWAAHASRELGFRVLRNECRGLCPGPDGEPRFTLAGVDDHRSGMLPGEAGEDLERALAEAPPKRPVVLLAHDPTTFKRASLRGVDLQLSGHTHGGQIWPFAWLVRAAVPFVAGLYRRGGATLYVSRGTGFWGPPMRLGAPAEITELTLRSRPSEA